MGFVKQHLWLSPIILFLVIVGIVQPIALVILGSLEESGGLRAIKYLTLSTVLAFVSFIFSMKAPASHVLSDSSDSHDLQFLLLVESLDETSLADGCTSDFDCGIVFHIVLAIDHFRDFALC
jgi:hypothetical protein